MPLRPAAAALALIVAALAGCASKDPGDATATHTGTHAAGGAAGLMPPVLKVGDWWNFTAPGGDLSYVISGESGDDYVMDTDNAGLAFFNAQSDVSTLGAIRKSDLAGSQGKDRVQFMQWPLTDGRNWTTTWDGLTISIAAKVSGETAQMTAKRANGTLFATYTYSNKTRWFTAFDFMDDKGQPNFAIKLQASGSAFPGKLLRYSLVPALEVTDPAPQAKAFNIPGAITDVWLSYASACSSGSLTVAFGQNPPVQATPEPGLADNGFTDSDPCPKNVVFQGPIGRPQSPSGDGWGLLVASSGPADPTASLHMLALYRTLTTFEAGKAPSA